MATDAPYGVKLTQRNGANTQFLERTLEPQANSLLSFDAGKLPTSTLLSSLQPANANLSAVAALTTAVFGLSLLTMTDAAAARTALGVPNSFFDGAFSSLTGRPTTLAGYGITDSFPGTFGALTGKPTTIAGYGIVDAQPLDSDLTDIAALTTTAFGRGLLTEASAATARGTLGAGTSNFSGAFSALTGIPTTIAGYGITDSFAGTFGALTGKPTTIAGYGITDAQPLSAQLTSIAALTGTSFGRDFLTLADAAAARTYIGAGAAGFSGAFADLSGIPTTIAGYGITDAFSGVFADLTGKPTTIAGYGIADAQPLDSDLTDIAALTTTAFGRGLLTEASAATARGTLGAGTSNFSGAFSALTGIPTTLGGYGITDAQPLDADLTAIAALTTTAYGRSVLTQADAAAVRTLIGAGTSSFDGVFTSLTSRPTTLAGYGITDAQPLDADLTAIAALTTDSFGLALLTKTTAAAIRTYIGAGTSSFDGVFTSLTSIPTTLGGYGITDAQPLDSDLTSIAALTTTSFGRGLLTEATAASARTTLGAGTSSFSGAFSALTGIPTTIGGYGITDAQPLDSDLTAIAALATTAFGRSVLTQADATAVRTLIGAGTSSYAGYTLPAATTTVLGGVIVPASGNLSIDGSGNLTVAAASSTVFGVMKTSTGLTATAGVVTVNVSQNISTLSNLTSNGSVQTTGGTGALSVVANTGTGSNVMGTAPTITGGTHTALTGLGIRSTGAAFDLTLASSEVLTAGRTLSVVMGDAARTLTLSGNPTIADWFNQSVKTTASPTFVSPQFTTSLLVGNQAASGAILDIQTAAATATTLRIFQNGVSNYGFVIPASTDALTIQRLGTEIARFNLSGNLGIGTTSPQGRLNVSAAGAEGLEFYPAYSSGLNLLQSYNRSGASYSTLRLNALDYQWQISGTECMRIDIGGNVGIGAAAPTDTRLKIFGADTSASKYALVVADSASSSLFYVRNDGLSYFSGSVGIGAAPSVFKLNVTSGSNAYAIQSSTVGDFVWSALGGASGTTQMFSIRNNSTGSVCINTANSIPLVLGVSTGTTSGSVVNHLSISASGTLTLPGIIEAVGTSAAVNIRQPAGGCGMLLEAYTGTANTGMIIRFARGGALKWDFGTGVSVGGDYFELYDRTGGISVIQVAPTTAAIQLAGNLGVAVTPGAVRLYVKGAGTSTGYAFYVTDSANNPNFLVRDDGVAQLSKINSNTSAAAANVYVDSFGTLYKSTSSARYKNNIVDYSRGLADVLKLRPVSYNGISAVDAGKTFAGLIAEEVEAAGLTEYVTYDDKGRPDALQYSQMVALLISAVKEMSAEIKALKAA